MTKNIDYPEMKIGFKSIVLQPWIRIVEREKPRKTEQETWQEADTMNLRHIVAIVQ